LVNLRLGERRKPHNRSIHRTPLNNSRDARFFGEKAAMDKVPKNFESKKIDVSTVDNPVLRSVLEDIERK